MLRKYIRTIGAAFCLLTIGLAFLIVSIVYMVLGDVPTRAIAFLIVGILCILPGGYQCFVLYQAWKRKSGYQFNMVPSYDDE